MLIEKPLIVRPKALRTALYTTQTNSQTAKNGTSIPVGDQEQQPSGALASVFPFLASAGNYPMIGTPCLVKASGKFGNFIPAYSASDTGVSVKAGGWTCAMMSWNKDAQSTGQEYIPKSLAATLVGYKAAVPAITASGYSQFTVPTPAGLYVTGITVEATGSGTWWTGECCVAYQKAYFPTTGTLDVGMFMPGSFSCSAGALNVWVWGVTKPLTAILVPNPACNEGSYTYANWTKPANFVMMGAYQIGTGSGNWYAMSWGLAGANGGTGFNWQRAASAVTNSVVFGMPVKMGQANVNNRVAGAVTVAVVGVQY